MRVPAAAQGRMGELKSPSRHNLQKFTQSVSDVLSDFPGLPRRLRVRIIRLLVDVNHIRRPAALYKSEVLETSRFWVRIHNLTLAGESFVNKGQETSRFVVRGRGRVDFPACGLKMRRNSCRPVRFLDTYNLRSVSVLHVR